MTNEIEKLRKLMKLHNITYSELGEAVDRSPHTVRQRFNTPSTFHKHIKLYQQGLKKCIDKKEQEKLEALEDL